jgi:hypothetical protein
VAGGARLAAKGRSVCRPLFVEPAHGDVEWLAQNATRATSITHCGSCDTRRRALGLIAAQRDALDDRTASIVAREIRRRFSRDQDIAAENARDRGAQFNARLSAYRDGLRRGGRADVDPDGPDAVRVRRGSFKLQDANIVRAGELLCVVPDGSERGAARELRRRDAA